MDRTYQCQAVGCIDGSYRKDKLAGHVRSRHPEEADQAERKGVERLWHPPSQVTASFQSMHTGTQVSGDLRISTKGLRSAIQPSQRYAPYPLPEVLYKILPYSH